VNSHLFQEQFERAQQLAGRPVPVKVIFASPPPCKDFVRFVANPGEGLARIEIYASNLNEYHR
jgi:hypothetical protein